jgi:hypothetical protein
LKALSVVPLAALQAVIGVLIVMLIDPASSINSLLNKHQI